MIKLIEYGEEQLLKKGLYSDEDKYFLNKLKKEDIKSGSRRFDLRETSEGLYIKPYNHIGSIQLSKELISIYPRFNHSFNKVILMMLYSKNINYKIFDNKLNLLKGEYNFYEILIINLINEAKELLKKGIYKNYIEHNENLTLLKGRIDFNNHIKSNFINERIFCKFEELESNTCENSVILKALKMSKKLTKNSILLKELRRYESIFNEICTEFRESKLPKFKYNRLNNHYKEIHYYCEIIIEKIGIEDVLSIGSNISRYSLLVDMNELFEAFVTQLCKNILYETYEVIEQKNIRNAIINNNDSCYREIIPDIILRNKDTDEYTVIDTKNKNYGLNKVSNADIYQVSFYGMYLSNIFKRTVNIAIVYPKYENLDKDTEEIYIRGELDSNEKIKISVIGIDIDKALLSIKEKYKLTI